MQPTQNRDIRVSGSITTRMNNQDQVYQKLCPMNNYNPNIDEFLKFYSQSELSTKGTRGYDPKTYVETKLDAKLTPTIFDAKTKLVILSGNAGDGKTAYIQRVE